MQFDGGKNGYVMSQDTQYCVKRATGSPQPKSITFTAKYNAKAGNTLYFYADNYFSKLWSVNDTNGADVTKTVTVNLGAQTNYCFGNVALVGNSTIKFGANRYLNVSSYTFNY
jgi:hypothetical protein